MKQISDYDIIETILECNEQGLYTAKQQSSEQVVLIKVYFPTLNWSDDVLIEFFDRFSYLQYIEHENLLPIIDMGKHEGVPYVVYSCSFSSGFEHQALQHLKEKEILHLFYEIAGALDFLHKQEILHGMLGTSNILMDAEGHPKLFDYGLTDVLKKLLSENTEDGFGNLSLSSINTTSPEQILGRTITRQSDIYAFGMLLCWSLLGAYPYESNSVPEIAAWQLNDQITKMVVATRRISKPALRFIQKCIQVNAEKRFPNFQELLRVLDRIRNRKWSRISYKQRLKLVAPRSIQRGKARWMVVPILLAIGAIVVLYFQNLGTKTTPASVPVTPTVTSTLPMSATVAATSVDTVVNEKPTTVPSAVPIVSAYRPAIQGMGPRSVSQKISTANITSIEEISRLGFGKPEHADFSPTGRVAALATSAGVLILDGSTVKTWIDPRGWATAVQFSPSGDTLAIGLVSGEIQVWDWQNNVQLLTLSGHSDRVTRLLFSGNGKSIYSASADQHVIVWNVASQSIARDLATHSEPVNDIAVSSDGRTLITCSDDHLVRVWDLAAGTKLYELSYPNQLQALALSSDDTYLAIGDDGGYIQQIDIKTRQPRTDPIPVKERIWSLQYINNDTKLLAGLDDGRTNIYNASQMRYAGISLMFKISPVSLELIKIFGSKFIFNSFALSSGQDTNVLTLRWDGEVQRNNSKILDGFFDSQNRLDFSSDGRVLAASGKRPVISVWDLHNNQILYQAPGVRLPLGDPISPDGDYLVVESGSYHLVSLINKTLVRDFSSSVSDGTVSYAGDGSIVIAANLRQSTVWDYKSGYETYFDSHPENGCFVTQSANNAEILQVNSAAGVMPKWNDDMKLLCAKSFVYVNSVSALSQGTGLFLYRNSSGIVEGFDPAQNKTVWRYPRDSKPESPVTALAVSSDGSVVVIGNDEGFLLFLDGPTGSLLGQVVGNFGSVAAIRFSDDDMKLATAGSDGTVRIFGVTK